MRRALLLFIACMGASCDKPAPPSSQPAPILVAGDAHICVVSAPGVLHCWGQNHYRQSGLTPRQATLYAPRRVQTLSNARVVDVGLGFVHTCVMLHDGAVKCWGNNEYRQLGDQTFDDRTSPAPVSGVHTSAVDLDVSAHQSCVVTRQGAVKCWGSKMYDDRGVMGPVVESDAAVLVPGLSGGASLLSLGHNHGCVSQDKKVKCWGNNSHGQLASDSVTDSTQPLVIKGVTDAVAITSGRDFSCALTRANKVRCWGAQSTKILGSHERSEVVDVQMPQGKIVQVVAGLSHVCARFKSGKVACWGSNGSGELGRGDRTESVSTTPAWVSVTSLSALDLSAGGGYTCLRTGDSALTCWGSNVHGQLGEDTTRRGLPKLKTMTWSLPFK